MTADSLLSAEQRLITIRANNSARAKRYRGKHAVAIAVYRSQYRATHKEQRRESGKRYRAKNSKSIKQKRAALDKSALAEYHRNYQIINRDKIKAQRKLYAERTRSITLAKNRERYRLDPTYSREYALKNKDKIRQRMAEWMRRRRAHLTASENARRARKHKATPCWFDPSSVDHIYNDARDRTLETGIQHDVDHIVPLKNERVCGLHVAWNLRVITHEENVRKKNKFFIAA